MSNPPQDKAHTLPESLRLQLKGFRLRVWKMKVIEATLAGILGLLFSYLIVFILDRFLSTPNSVRLIILLAGISIFAIFLPFWVNRWVFKLRNENQIAHLIAKQYPRLGDRLLGVVELQTLDESKESSSLRLREAAMETVALEIQRRGLLDALPRSLNKKATTTLLGLTALTIAASLISPKASWNALQRWMMPLAAIERYTQTQIDPSSLPHPLYVAHGEPLDFTLRLTKDSNTPASANARFGKGDWISSPVTGNSYHFKFPKILNDTKVAIRVGDADVTLTIKPVMRPRLESISANVRLPEYLQLANEKLTITSGKVPFLEGSSLEIIAQSNRTLTHAQAEIFALDDTKGTKPAPIAAHTKGKTLQLAPLSPQHEISKLSLNWTDSFGLSNGRPTQLTLHSIPDAPANAYAHNIEDELFLLADSSIEFELAADDDFGLKQVGLEWQGSFTKPSPHQPAKGELTAIKGSPKLKNASEPIIFSFPVYNIVPQKLILRVWAEDYNPQHARSYSSPITIYVLTKQEHRELIEKRTQAAINKLEEILRTEINAFDQNKRLDRLSGKELQEETHKQQLAEQSEQEKENNAAMKSLSKEMEELFQEATRNGEIDPQTLKQLADSTLEMKQMADKAMPKIAKKLDDAQSLENTEERTKSDLQEAVQEQSELLKKMQSAIAKANQAKKQLEAGTFVKRLLKAAGDEEQLANTLIEAVTHPSQASSPVISREFEQLDPSDQRILLDLFSFQQQTNADIRWIIEDLGHFYARTQQAEHKDLLDTMKLSRIDARMEQLLSDIENNHNSLGWNGAKSVAQQLREWAKTLQNASSKNSAGGGGGGGNGGGVEDFEFMLKIIEITQQETNIRAANRALEQKRRFSKLQASPESIQSQTTPQP